MKYKAKEYAMATSEAIKSGASMDAARIGLLKTLGRTGDRSRLLEITQELEKILTKEAGGKMVHVEFARAMGANERESILTAFGKKDRVVTGVNPELIAGVRITYDEEKELDFTLASKLRSMKI